MDLNGDLSSGVIKLDLRKRVPLGTFDYRRIWRLDMPQEKHYTEWLIACFFGSWKAKKGIDLTHFNYHLGIYSSFGIVVPSAPCQPTVPWLVPDPKSVPYLLHFILILGENHEPSTQNSCGKKNNIGNYTYTYGHIVYIMCIYIYITEYICIIM